NTCGFIADATNESVEAILSLADYKNRRCKRLIAAGCVAKRYSAEILDEIPELDAIITPGEYKAIVSVVAGDAAPDGISGAADEADYLKRIPATPAHFAYLKIAEGCDNCCAYCAIPSIRGRYVSRGIDGLIAEAERLTERGVKELILVAQDTALYGKDLYGKPHLHVLLRRLSEIEGIIRLRIMYCYPEHITDELISEMRVNPKICRYLDMPVQHGSPAVLKRMGRQGTDIRKTVAGLRAAMPDIVLRTSIIVGFPGETEEEFSELLRFVEDIRFDRLGVFAYSREDGTPAAKMKGQIKKAVKDRRREQVMRLQQRISAENCEAQLGKELDILVDGYLPDDGVYCGRSYMDSYEVDGMVFFESPRELMAGDLCRVRITGGSEYDLRGEPV
ncbi:MAG: 30S ribosomal protein S12 methylthiotransferase RimO, partial [Defluviitaleaceae bacterium]|nr:30S ribosomal protein S12 methylthiotransferase RimO [Defluviitaleaceae bacterium]